MSGRRGKSTLGLWITVAMLAFFLLMSGAVNLGLLAGMSAGGGESLTAKYPVDQEPRLRERWSYGYGETKVARIPLMGPIMRGGQGGLFEAAGMVESVLAQIRTAQNDGDVEAIILEVDSPGGAVTASDELYMALRRFRESTPERKVVIFVRDMAASGAYYVAMAGDRLIAEPTSIVGSVGVLFQSLNVRGLSEKIGVEDVTITSGRHKDLLNPFREVQEEDVEILQKLVDDAYRRFAGIVMEARGFENLDLLDGRVFPARTAKENGLIDEIGYWEHAVNAAAGLLGAEELYVVRYEMPRGLAALFGRMESRLGIDRLARISSPRLYYLWNP
ncbi:signal peptide peptidase SppA [Kiritimatiella glycovorans]|uniref:Signal peptide peptidase SppA n=1 Tax=Kiritimatiella glycovorans TaxID=1307763 RepID=A0A0G3EJ66_9BACT|nr:signal peptide peptidase SppA [Kiritimatiella glycovorans]AKJ65482.1 Putative signal peptide peptidase SppA [Kiritimatiella glycovorans]